VPSFVASVGVGAAVVVGDGVVVCVGVGVVCSVGWGVGVCVVSVGVVVGCVDVAVGDGDAKDHPGAMSHSHSAAGIMVKAKKAAVTKEILNSFFVFCGTILFLTLNYNVTLIYSF
jgi:hypothetical protein